MALISEFHVQALVSGSCSLYTVFPSLGFCYFFAVSRNHLFLVFFAAQNEDFLLNLCVCIWVHILSSLHRLPHRDNGQLTPLGQTISTMKELNILFITEV